MQKRSARWFACSGRPRVARSNDGWMRIRVGLNAEPVDRPSWAIDREREAERVWDAAEASAPRRRTAAEASRVYSATGTVEGKTNPHADTRGVVPETVGGDEYAVAIGEAGPFALFVARSTEGIRIDLPVDESARVYGLGEKSGGLDKRGRTWAFWNTDDPIHYPEKDPLYQSIPVACLVTRERVVTVFSDSCAHQYFDVCESAPDRLRIEVYDDQADLYLRVDDGLPQALAAYTGLTGRMPLPPLWALGFHQCRYSYYPEERVMEVAERLRSESLPCDVIYLDIHYMDGYRVFTWHPERFPDPARMIRRLAEMGLRVVTIVDPGVKTDPGYPVYADGLSGGCFLTRSDGSLYVGAVWPGKSAFPDFSREEVRAWWAARHRSLFDAGVAGIWNDMNEPADFSGDATFRPDFTVPDDLIAGNDGRPVPFAHVHNAYGSGMCAATREALRDQRPDERGFVLTRAGYAGIQRHAAVWAGDNHSWWEHVALMTPMMLGLGLSGVAFCGVDTGGFSSNADGELFARWFAASCLMPFFRAHTALDTVDHEPWSFGPQVLAIVRSHIELRYQLLPYLYTLFEEASRTGAPVVRPLVWHYPDDASVANRTDCFLLGPSLLVAPVRERGVAERSVYLPAGRWYDFWSGELSVGPGAIVAPAPLDRLPLYLRAGSIIPYEAVRLHTGEPGDGVLRLLVAPDTDGRASGELYADAGEGYAYRDGEYWRARFGLSDGAVRVEESEGRGPETSRWSMLAAVRAGKGLPVDDAGEPITPGTRGRSTWGLRRS